MSIRKFGTSDDHKVEVAREDEQGVSKESIKRTAASVPADQKWAELQKENES